MRRLYESGTAAGHALRAGLYFRTRRDVVVETARGARSVPECEMLTGLTPAGVVEPRVDYAYVFEDDYRLESEPAEHEAESDAELDGDLAADAAPITDGNIWRDQEVLGMPRRVLSGLALGALGVLLGIVLGASILIAAAWLLARVAGLFGG